MNWNTLQGDDPIGRRFSTYVLPGRIVDAGRAMVEARDAQSVGLGGVWLSERFALKEPAVLCGALSQSVPGLRLGGTMYANMRHPVVTASVANLLQALTDDRFILVLARAVPGFWTDLGLPPLTFRRLAEFIDIARRLWAGETVSHDGALGRYPRLYLLDRHEGPPPPMVFTAIGPKSLAFAGEHCDGVLLHPLLTHDAVARSAAIVRTAAEQAGRDPAAVRIIANVIVAPDLPADEEEAVVGGRAVTYLQTPGYGEIIASVNGWDAKGLEALRAHRTLQALDGEIADQAFTRQQLVEASRALPAEWLSSGNAVGTASECARRLCGYLDAGADEILLHGAAPASLGLLVAELRKRLV